MSRGSTKIGLAGITIALLAVGIVIYSRSERDQAPDAAALQPIPVIATTVQQRDMPIILTGLGTVTALNTAAVHSQITGLLISVDFKEGQLVKKGDLLARIDPRTYQAQLDQAEATLSHDQTHLQNAQTNLQRYGGLAKENSIALEQVSNQQAAVDELIAQIKSDQAAIDNTKAQLSYTSLVAPFDGVTGFRLLDVGNIIHPPTSSAASPAPAQSMQADPNALVVVTEVQPISVIFTVATTSIPEVQDAVAKGPLQAIAYSQDDKTQLDTGSLLVVNNQADPSSGTVQLKAVFPNQQRQLWPGTFVSVRLVLSTQHDALTVPLDAVQQGPQGRVVFVVGPDHKVALRPVSMRQSLNGVALIETGLHAGETVVVRGQYRLSPGTLVTLANPNDPDAVPNPSTASSGMLP
ncbi:MAG TPA: efflux RND transporter periplasmic adaptor subunit [Bradyrhizobium sp.]|nr:efflux RND transporter periplasmic adaptor subunit [Bradyrhizobium sp.]